MKKVKLLLAAFVLLGLQNVYAINGLWLQKKDGKTIGYLFEDEFIISYSRTSLIIKTPDATVEHAFDDINKIYFDSNVTNSNEKVTRKELQKILITACGIDISGFREALPVILTDLTGRTIMRGRTNCDGSLYINKKDLSKGVFIVKADKTAIKFCNK